MRNTSGRTRLTGQPVGVDEPVVEALGVTVSYRHRGIHVDAVADVSFACPAGSLTALVGPNGSGKSTLLSAVAALLTPRRGSIRVHGQSVVELAGRDRARLVAHLPQSPQAPDGLTVLDLVRFGRHPHQGWLRAARATDEQCVDDAITRTGLDGLRNRELSHLSGGQRQRAWIAMVLAQESPVVLLDEPTSALDLAHQFDVLDLLVELRAAGRAVIVVLHDLQMAARVCDRMLILADGQLVAQGPPSSVLTDELTQRVFAVRSRILDDGTFIAMGAAARSADVTSGATPDASPDSDRES